MTRFGVRYVDNITATGAVKNLDGAVTPTGEGLLEQPECVEGSPRDQSGGAGGSRRVCRQPGARQHPERTAARAKAVVAERFPEMEVMALFFDPRIGFEKIH